MKAAVSAQVWVCLRSAGKAHPSAMTMTVFAPRQSMFGRARRCNWIVGSAPPRNAGEVGTTVKLVRSIAGDQSEAGTAGMSARATPANCACADLRA